MNSSALKLHKKSLPVTIEIALYGKTHDRVLHDMVDSLKCKIRMISLEQK